MHILISISDIEYTFRIEVAVQKNFMIPLVIYLVSRTGIDKKVLPGPRFEPLPLGRVSNPGAGKTYSPFLV